MNRRNILTISVAVFLVVGIIAAGIPFIKSMNPSASAGASLPHIDISGLKDGSYIFREDPVKGYFNGKFLIIRDHSSKIHVFTIPVIDKRVMLPDITWWKYGGACESFRPELKNGSIKKDGMIQCHDGSISEFWENEWRWNYEGRNLGKYTQDMLIPKYKIIGDYLIIGRT